jgi:CheY-like chemotaxis protein
MSTPAVQPKTIVLNVNDTDSMRIAISAMLRHAGFEVIEATTGEEALEVIERQEPHLVVLDINLPGANGYEICRRIRANPFRATMRILLTSAMSVSLEDKIESLESGADGFLEQPFELDSLFSCIRSLLDEGQATKPLAGKAPSASSEAAVEAPSPDHILEVLESLSDGMFCLDASWRFTFVNAMAERILGRTRGELLGQVIWTVLPGLETSTLGVAYRRAMTEGVPVTVDGIRPAFNVFVQARALPTARGLLVQLQNSSAALQPSRRSRAERSRRVTTIGKREKTLRGM